MSSWIFRWPSVLAALTKAGAQRIAVRLIDFGGDSVKPLEIWGTCPWLTRLEQIGHDRREHMARHDIRPRKRVKLTNQVGRWVCGNEYTHASQVYPQVFCAIIAELHARTLIAQGIPIV